MSGEGRSVVSREYKVMLRAGRFGGDEKKLLEAANALWREFSRSVEDVVIATDGELGHVKPPREITFFDTANQDLKAGSYVLRERREIESREREVTLKFRHPDRYVAQDRNMDARDSEEARTKFEEDIKVPFLCLYSFSTTVPIGKHRSLDELSDAARLFPDIAGKVDGFQGDDALAAVNGFTARELVLSGASLRLGKGQGKDAECALIVWYDAARQPDTPVAVEFSYRYGNKNEGYGGAMAGRAFHVFNRLQTELPDWVDPDSRTKTAFVYG
jgi:hypothetical protein